MKGVFLEAALFQKDPDQQRLVWDMPKMATNLWQLEDLQGWPGASLSPDQWSVAKSRQMISSGHGGQCVYPGERPGNQVWVFSPLAYMFYFLLTAVL